MSLTNSASNLSLSGLLGGELLSEALSHGLESNPSISGLFSQVSRDPQGAVIETEPQWQYEGSLIATDEFLLDSFEVLAERYAVNLSHSAIVNDLPAHSSEINISEAASAMDIITGATAGVGEAVSLETTFTTSDWFVDQGNYSPAVSDWYTNDGDNSLATASYQGWLNGAVTINNSVGAGDEWDYYSFVVGQDSIVNLSMTGMTNDADLYLIRDFNGNQIFDTAEVMSISKESGKTAETIEMNVGAGFYHVAVRAYHGDTQYSLNMAAAGFGFTQELSGSLGADQFVVNPAATRSVFSGNGNIDFGSGWLDHIDATSIHSSSVVDWNFAGITGAGVAHDDGNGTRIFDAMTLSTGQQILFEGMDSVRFADQEISLAVRPNDPLFDQQWNLHMMGVHNAWRFTTGSEQVVIGIGDSGLGVDPFGNLHPDLRQSNLRTLAGNTRDEMFRERMDEEFGPRSASHGTAVQGIIAAQSNNGVGISGINWVSPTINLDVDVDNNFGDLNLAETTQTMINDASARGEKLIVNLSISSSNSIESVVKNNRNTLFVVSAGNNAEQQFGISTPAILAERYDNVIAVGASSGRHDNNGIARLVGERLPYSQFGPGLTLMGPTEVPTTVALNINGQAEFTFDPMFNGTSAAAPNVSGVASLVWSANSNLSAGQIKQILSETAYRDLPGYNSLEYGSGFVNADAAVRRAIAMA